MIVVVKHGIRVVVTALLAIALGTSVHAAPRKTSKRLSIEKINLKMLNITTVIPGAYAVGEAHHSSRKRTIDDVCRRIHKQVNPHVIDTTIYDSGSFADQYRVMSGVVPVEDPIIFVYSSGWSGWPGEGPFRYQGGGLYGSYSKQRRGIMPGVTISFDYPTHTRAMASFGQELDQHCLRMVLNEIRRVNPDAAIVLVGTCSGGATVLNCMAQHSDELQQVKAVILETPAISLKYIERHLLTCRLGRLYKHMPRILTHYFSNYDPEHPTILDLACHVPRNIPLLIGALCGDSVVAYTDVCRIVHALRAAGHTHVELLALDRSDIRHAHMAEAKEWQHAVQLFLDNYVLGHVTESPPTHLVHVRA